MTGNRRFFAVLDDRGSVAVELALMTPVVLLIIWLFAGFAHTWRMESAVHRATAALADVLTNQSTSETDFEDMLEKTNQFAGDMFLDMVSGESSADGKMRSQMQYGLTLTYYDTSSTAEWSASSGGTRCNVLQTQDLKTLGTKGDASALVTSQNLGELKLLRVDACITYPGLAMFSLLTPSQFNSSFIGVRREE